MPPSWGSRVTRIAEILRAPPDISKNVLFSHIRLTLSDLDPRYWVWEAMGGRRWEAMGLGRRAVEIDNSIRELPGPAWTWTVEG